MTITVIKGTKHPDGYRFNQELGIRQALDRGETVYVVKNGVYFRPIQDGDQLRFEALPKKPDGV